MKSESCLHDLREHSGDIYTLQWSPTGPGSENPSANPMLATSVTESRVTHCYTCAKSEGTVYYSFGKAGV